MNKKIFSIHLCILFFIALISPTQSYAVGLPNQNIVLIIDNSESMKDSDPLRLRGVAASLILDAADLE
jgi:hypothetical protein